ncbi:MAG: hypothetical protein MJ181_03910 [Treponema sp.]|nr:hypothetical protein [Treponema sp.]
MKKFLAVVACLFVAAGAFSQAVADATSEFEKAQKIEEQSTMIQTIRVPEGFVGMTTKQYMIDEVLKTGGEITIEYSPLYDEVRIYYTCLLTAYERGEAMNTVLAVLQDFESLTKYINVDGKEMTKDRYYKYSYLVPDKEKYFRDDRLKKAQYISYVKFSK